MTERESTSTQLFQVNTKMPGPTSENL